MLACPTTCLSWESTPSRNWLKSEESELNLLASAAALPRKTPRCAALSGALVSWSSWLKKVLIRPSNEPAPGAKSVSIWRKVVSCAVVLFS